MKDVRLIISKIFEHYFNNFVLEQHKKLIYSLHVITKRQHKLALSRRDRAHFDISALPATITRDQCVVGDDNT